MAKNTKTPAMILQEWSVKKGFASPTYEIIFSRSGTHDNRFDYQVSVGHITTAIGTGSSKQVSKHNAAHNALMQLEEMGLYVPHENPTEVFMTPKQGAAESPFKSAPNCIGPLKDMCLEYKIPYPIFTIISEVGPPHSKDFTFECCVSSIKTIATGNTKKMAKQLAAQDMLQRLKDVLPEVAAEYTNNIEQQGPTDLDNSALKSYNQLFGNIIFDKTIKIEDYPSKFKIIMQEKGLSYDDLSNELKDRTEESLKSLLDKLDLTYTFHKIQDNPLLMSLTLSIDVPFTTIGLGTTEEEASNKALYDAFDILHVYLED